MVTFCWLSPKLYSSRSRFPFSSGGRGPIQSLCEQNLPFLVFSQVPSAKVVSTLPSFRAPGCLSEKSPALRCAFPWPCSPQSSLFHHELRSVFKAPLISLSPFPFIPPAAPSSCLRPGLLPHPVFLQLLILSAFQARQSLLLLVFSLLMSAGILYPLCLLCKPQTELFLGHLPLLAGDRSHLLKTTSQGARGDHLCPSTMVVPLPELLYLLWGLLCPSFPTLTAWTSSGQLGCCTSSRICPICVRLLSGTALGPWLGGSILATGQGTASPGGQSL